MPLCLLRVNQNILLVNMFLPTHSFYCYKIFIPTNPLDSTGIDGFVLRQQFWNFKISFIQGKCWNRWLICWLLHTTTWQLKRMFEVKLIALHQQIKIWSSLLIHEKVHSPFKYVKISRKTSSQNFPMKKSIYFLYIAVQQKQKYEE